MAEIWTKARQSMEKNKPIESKEAIEIIQKMESLNGMPILLLIREIILAGKADSVSLRSDKPRNSIYIRRSYDNGIIVEMERAENTIKVKLFEKDLISGKK